MIVHGTWEGTALPHRPTINAFFSHPCTKRDFVSLKFLIDTGADQTFIVPEHQDLLHIPYGCTDFQVKPVDTLAGKYPFNFLTGCSLTFISHDNTPKIISDVTVYFAVKPKTGVISKILGLKEKEVPLGAGGVYPSILGRDVLSQLCMGYCSTSDYLFLSQRYADYHKCLSTHFPKPPTPTKPHPKWLGTDFDIADVETDYP